MNTRSLFRKLRKHPSPSSENYLGNLEKSPNQTEPPNPETETDPDLYFLSLVDPAPALPPSYENQLAITAGPVYYDYSLFGKEQLPSYTPTVYKLAILSVKPELKTPFEKARTRYWSKYVVELNSTQLNLYTYNSSDILERGHNFNESQINPSDYNSRFTQTDELEKVRIFKRKGLLDNDRVVRSYSLQYGKVGLATDYEQKLFVLRVRLETQQFLIDFSDAKQMIYWYHALCAGIDNSLDLTRRTMPIYSSVPYRRWDAQVHGGTVTNPSESSNIN